MPKGATRNGMPRRKQASAINGVESSENDSFRCWLFMEFRLCFILPKDTDTCPGGLCQEERSLRMTLPTEKIVRPVHGQSARLRGRAGQNPPAGCDDWQSRCANSTFHSKWYKRGPQCPVREAASGSLCSRH